MRFSVTFKLFLALLATCIAVALAMGLAVRMSFQSGFGDYVQEREVQRLDDLAQTLAAEYAESGNWEFVRSERKHWSRALRLMRHEKDADHEPALRVTLTDAAGVWLAGPRLREGADLYRHPVRVAGDTVGWLLSPARMPQAVSDAIDRRFQARQLSATWMIVGLSVLLATGVSLLLARLLLVPVRRMARATHLLASGRYETRVRVESTDELGRLARDFNRLAHNLERNRRLRHELMADVSHELRTPLAVLRGEIEALQDGLRKADDTALASLAHEVAQLSRLIDDLYDLSLADAGALDYSMQAVDLSALVEQAVQGVRERFERAGLLLEVQVPDSLPIQGDARRLLQLLGNLLENSLRYTDAPGQVRVRVGREADQVLLEVADSAPGVPPADHARLFDRLYRVEASRSRQHGGAGLGLALCRAIVQAHGGQISAGSSDLGGLAIRVQWGAS